MNQATSRRLRARTLLLLLPLLMASTPPAPPLTSVLALAPAGQPDHLAFVNLPPEFLKDRCTQLGVELRDSNDAPVKATAPLHVTLLAELVGGTFYTDNCATNPVNAVDILPDTTGRQVWFRASATGGVTLTASDELGGLGPALSGVISVVNSLTTELRFSNVPSSAKPGVAFNVTVTAFNQDGVASGYAGTVHFTSSDSRAILPPNYTFDPQVDGGSKNFSVTLLSLTTSNLTVQDDTTPLAPVQSPQITVQAASPAKSVVMTALPSTTVPACGPVTLNIQALDDARNPTTEPVSEFQLCKSQGSSATFVSTTLEGGVSVGDCVTGLLNGQAQVVWRDPVEEQVEFRASGISAEPILITWKGGIPSKATSSLEFVETSELLPPLRTYTGKLTLQLTLRDLCQHPAPLPAGKTLSFAADAPLFVSDPPEQDAQEKNVWRVTTRLPQCPANPSQPLAIWPLLNGVDPSDGRIERRVQPLCLPPNVQLKLLTPAENLAVEPGALSEFVVEISNADDQPITDGVFMLSNDGLKVLSASIGDKPLTGKAEGFELPELRKDAPLTVKVQVQATTQPDHPVQSTVWCAHPDGSLLTEKTLVSFTAEKLGVDVGCGCQASSPASQLLPWLALLLLASRPWERLRRLRRGERIDD